MGITLAKIAKNAAKVEFEYIGQSVHIEYHPSKVTEKVYADLTSFSEMNQETIAKAFTSLNSVLIALIKKWDVFEDDSETIMYPLVQERLQDLPITFRMAALNAILGDIRPEAVASQS